LKGNNESAITLQANPVSEVDDNSPNSKTEDVEKSVDSGDEEIQNRDKDYSKSTDV